MWGKQAELCLAYLAKGRQVYVEGRLRTRSYTDQGGIERWSTEIVAKNVLFLGTAPRNAAGTSAAKE